MPDIDIKRAHGLGLKGARAAADSMVDQLARKFGLKGGWSGDTLNFERPGLTGSLAVGEKDVRLTVTLGLLLKAMRGSIESAVQQELDKLFEKAGAPAKTAPKPKKASPRPKKGG